MSTSQLVGPASPRRSHPPFVGSDHAKLLCTLEYAYYQLEQSVCILEYYSSQYAYSTRVLSQIMVGFCALFIRVVGSEEMRGRAQEGRIPFPFPSAMLPCSTRVYLLQRVDLLYAYAQYIILASVRARSMHTLQSRSKTTYINHVCIVLPGVHIEWEYYTYSSQYNYELVLYSCGIRYVEINSTSRIRLTNEST